MKRRAARANCLAGLAALAAAAWIGLTPQSARAQNYSFRVPKLEMQVLVNPDASAKIVYDISFENNRAGHVIDVVDIGVPHKGYKLGNVTASAGGVPLGDIRHSKYVTPGFEVHMAGRAIPGGASGALHVEFTMPNMVYQDTTREDYASLRITPTWFDGRFVTGTTDLALAVHLPKSVKPDEALHHGKAFSQKVLTDEGTSVVWQWHGTRLTGPHLVGVSFPKRDMQKVVKVSKLGLLLKWFGESPEARVVVGIVFFAMFGFAFFRFTGGTGVSVFVVLSAGLVFLFYHSPACQLASLPLVAAVLGLNEWYLRRRKPSYMPPIAQVEGGGIKRGLTAPEAAALLEMPIPRVLGLVIFGMLNKGVLRQTRADPLAVEIDEAFRTDQASTKAREAFYREAAQKKGIVIHKYEYPFLFLLEKNPGKPVREINFAVPLKKLIERVVGRMRGFDVSQTQAYYRSICRKAVRQARQIGDIPQREKQIDRTFEWILLDDDYPTVFTAGHPYRPIWARGAGTMGRAAPAPPAPGIPGKTTLGDVSASFAGWAENTMGGMADAISPGSLTAGRPSGGFINLSGADRVTGEFFQALAESSRSSGGGGGGGGCACACAGCACACACAGGGR